MKRFLFFLQENPGKKARRSEEGIWLGDGAKKWWKGGGGENFLGIVGALLLISSGWGSNINNILLQQQGYGGDFEWGKSPNLNALITTKGGRFFPLWVGAKTYFITLSLSLSFSPFSPWSGEEKKEENWEYTGCWGGEKLLIPADKGWENIQEFQILPYHRDTHTLILFPPYLVLNISMPYHAFPTFQVSEKI